VPFRRPPGAHLRAHEREYENDSRAPVARMRCASGGNGDVRLASP
jgi:hypothetical protein